MEQLRQVLPLLISEINCHNSLNICLYDNNNNNNKGNNNNISCLTIILFLFITRSLNIRRRTRAVHFKINMGDLKPVCTDPFGFQLCTGGGQICPPLNYCHRMTILLLFFRQISCLGCKGPESNSTALYLQNCSPEIFLKNPQFRQKS